MLNNHTYNLLKQLVQESKSLWRIKNNYMNDAGDCEDCKNLWKEIMEQKEAHAQKIEEIVKKHI